MWVCICQKHSYLKIHNRYCIYIVFPQVFISYYHIFSCWNSSRLISNLVNEIALFTMRTAHILFSMIVYAGNSLYIPWYYHLLASKLSLFIHLLELILIFNEHRHSVFIIYDYFTSIDEFLTLILLIFILLILIFIVKSKLLCESFLEVLRLHDLLIWI